MLPELRQLRSKLDDDGVDLPRVAVWSHVDAVLCSQLKMSYVETPYNLKFFEFCNFYVNEDFMSYQTDLTAQCIK